MTKFYAKKSWINSSSSSFVTGYYPNGHVKKEILEWLQQYDIKGIEEEYIFLSVNEIEENYSGYAYRYKAWPKSRVLPASGILFFVEIKDPTIAMLFKLTWE